MRQKKRLQDLATLIVGSFVVNLILDMFRERPLSWLENLIFAIGFGLLVFGFRAMEKWGSKHHE